MTTRRATFTDPMGNFPVPPPIERKIEALELTDPKIPGEIIIDASGKLLKKYFEYAGNVSSIIDGFDNWIYNILPRQLMSRTLSIPQGIVTFENITYDYPNITVKEKTKLLPIDARNSGHSYTATLYADLVLNSGTEQEERIQSRKLGKFPVMLGSVLDHLHGMTREELVEAGESVADPFGYFIIKGSEKVILIQEKLRTNRINMYVSEGNLWCKMTCETILGSSLVTLNVADSGAILIHLAFMGKTDKASDKLNMAVPVTSIFRLLGVEDPKDILKYISLFVDNKYTKRVWVQLQQTFVEDAVVGDVVNFLTQKQLGNLSYAQKESFVITSLKNELFPQIPPDNVQQKLYMLSIMIARTVEYQIGIRGLDDRDSMSNKRLETPSRSMEQLFGNIWREMITKTQDQLDIQKLSGLKSVERSLPARFIEKTYETSFGGNWGVQGSYMTQDPITDQLDRMSIISVFSHLTRVNTPGKRKGSVKDVRMVHMSQLGYIGPSESPEGEQCGLNNNLSITAWVSLERDENIILVNIETYINNALTEQTPNALILNGKFLGWVNGASLRDFCVNCRRSGVFPFDVNISLTHDGFLYIYTDAARATRPLLVVDANGELVIDKKNMWNSEWNELIREGCVEYIDAFEQEYLLIAQSMEAVSNTSELEETRRHYDQALAEYQQLLAKSEGEGQDPETGMYAYSISEAKQSLAIAETALADIEKKYRYTHCELDPSAMFSISSSLIPLANHNPGPRVTYQASMYKQGLGIYHSNYMTRFDKTSKMLVYPSRPLFETQMNEVIGLNELPAGENVILAFMNYTGFNQEDSIIMSKGAIERGLFRQMIYKSYTSVAEKATNTVETFVRPKISEHDQSRYAAIRADGLPRIGSALKEGDVIIGKVRRNTETGEETDISIKVEIGQEGIVDRVIISTNQIGKRVVKVKIREYRQPVVGDKFASRYAQKGTIGMILPDEDMPFVEGSVIRPDIIINPLSIPSRMTIGKLLEVVTSKAAVLRGERVNATSFRKFDLDEFERVLRQYGYNSQGTAAMMNGFTGERLKARIFIGPCYYLALKHHVKDKVQMRQQGGIRQTTHQPVSGRKAGGGLKVGEMERDAIIHHGASAFLQDALCTRSDAYETAWCYECGQMAITNVKEGSFICRSCGDNAKFGKCTIPYAYKLMTNYLAGAMFNLRLKLRPENEDEQINF